jgi:hypothetical protein
MSVWLLIVATLGGALLGGLMGLVNTRVQSKTMFSRERQKLILGKLEELHETLSQFSREYGDLELLASSDAAIEELIRRHASIPKERVEMLVGFYAPELVPKLREVEKLSGEYDDALTRLVNWRKQEEETTKKYLKEAPVLKKRLDAACAEMQAAVIALARKYI